MDSEEENEFYFESESLALKKNKDYQALVRCIALLEVQRSQAIKDIDTLKLAEKVAIENPINFIEQIKSGVDLKLPIRQKLAEIPKIDWSQYSEYLPEKFKKFDDEDGTVKIENEFDEEDKQEYKDYENKSGSKSFWTVAEQKRLEELLQIYPPEPIESRRFAKIAKALGNRTTKQVCSRIQKYFYKLKQAGLPIPGRIPKATTNKLGNKRHSHQRFNHFLLKPTTFFPEYHLPVKMDDDFDIPGPSQEQNHNDRFDTSSTTDKERKINLLERVKRDKELGQPFCFHTNYRCNYCNESPIYGTRWHCVTCENSQKSINYCTDCVVLQLDSPDSHPLSHNLQTIRVQKLNNDQILNSCSKNQHIERSYLIANSSKSNFDFLKTENSIEELIKKENDNDDYSSSQLMNGVFDRDYLCGVNSSSASFGTNNDEYNYLDPNFLPH